MTGKKKKQKNNLAIRLQIQILATFQLHRAKEVNRSPQISMLLQPNAIRSWEEDKSQIKSKPNRGKEGEAKTDCSLTISNMRKCN